MGQQQLLLVILVTIIVGIATVVAINTFGTAADQANIDAVRQDMLQISASAQQYYMRPEMLGGGGRSWEGITFNDFAFAAAGIDSDGETAQNENGSYVISGATAGAEFFVITGHPANSSAYTPGSIDNDGLLTDPGTAAADDQLEARVYPDRLEWPPYGN